MKLSSAHIPFMGLAIAVLVALGDQASKTLLLAAAKSPAFPIVIFPFFNLVLVWNRGISFGMLGSMRPWMPWALTLGLSIIVAVLLVWLWRTRDIGIAVALSFVIGGAAGNIIDRVRYGAVTDFLDFHVGPYHWPAFNIADSAIFIGVVILLCISIYSPRFKA